MVGVSVRVGVNLDRKEALMWSRWSKALLALVPAAGLLAIASSANSADLLSLPSFNIDTNQISVSGFSSGAYMAVQFDVAFSSILRGAGIVAGGPYYCAQNSATIATTTCSCFFGCFVPSPTDVSELIAVTDRNAARGAIDDTANLRAASHLAFLRRQRHDRAPAPHERLACLLSPLSWRRKHRI